MKLRDIISELTFHGRLCTKDCSGHKAGWEWERKNQTNQVRQTPSQSFNNGTEIAITQRRAGKEPIGTNIRGEKGRFQKFQKVKESTLTELFDRPAPWEWVEKEHDYLAAEFNVNQIPYVLAITRTLVYNKHTKEYDDLDVFNIEFQDLQHTSHFGVTGKLGSQSSIVFATVINILTEFKKSNPKATLQFTAEEPSRQKLYNRILGSLQQLGYSVKKAQGPDGMGYLVH